MTPERSRIEKGIGCTEISGAPVISAQYDTALSILIGLAFIES
jgi:hypothetical protein